MFDLFRKRGREEARLRVKEKIKRMITINANAITSVKTLQAFIEAR